MIGNIVELVAGRMGADDHVDDDVAQGSHTQGKERYYDSAGKRTGPNEHNAESATDRIYDDVYMAKVEKRVASYLEHIQQTQADGEFHRIGREPTHRNEKVASWDQIHKAQVHNRHVYFAGMPLGHSKEVMQIKRYEEHISRQAEELVTQLQKRDEQIEELVKKQNVDFLKFEVALGKAMGLGMGCHLFSETVERWAIRSKRRFFDVSRSKHMKELQRSVESQANKLRQRHKIAALVISRCIRILMGATLKEALRHMRIALTKMPRSDCAIALDAMKGQHYVVQSHFDTLKMTPVKKHQKGNRVSKHGGDHIGQVEESLLTRLEHLVAEEMQMLTSSHTIV